MDRKLVLFFVLKIIPSGLCCRSLKTHLHTINEGWRREDRTLQGELGVHSEQQKGDLGRFVT